MRGKGRSEGGWWEQQCWKKALQRQPAIDQKFMSVAGIRPACPLLAFMCRRCRQKGGLDIWDRHLFKTKSQQKPDWITRATQGHVGSPGAKRVIENRQMLDQRPQITLLSTHWWSPLKEALINDRASCKVPLMAETNESFNCLGLIWMWSAWATVLDHKEIIRG